MGGTPAPPPPVDYEAQARAQMLIQQEQARLDQAAQERQRAYEAQQREIDQNRFNTDLASARTAATSNVQDLLNTQYGSSPNALSRLSPLVDPAINNVAQGIPSLSDNVGSFFDAQSILDSIAGDARSQYQNESRSAIDAFAPTGFARTAIGDTTDDQYITSFLNDRYNQAVLPVERAFARGTLNDLGYNSALSDLDTQRSAGLGRLNEVGQGLISGARDELRGIADEARNRAGSLSLRDAFDPGFYQGRIDDATANALSNFGSNFDAAASGLQLFSPPTAISRGGVSQGITNPSASQNSGSIAAQILEQNQRDKTQTRGLGSTGAF